MKPTIPRGTRDFGPVEMARRNYIFNTIRSVFELYGFQPIETPTMENLSTLLGKYGEEGDKLLFRILNSGNYFDGIPEDEIKPDNSQALSTKISEKGLRYDLTVPFARFVVQHREELKFPFKRYQIQPVWRADRPQKGRYREFYQCDADVVGSRSLVNEVELVQMLDDVFSRFGINVTIKINNRKILSGIARYLGVFDDKKIADIITTIDKIDKISHEGIKNELYQLGLDDEQIRKLFKIFEEINEKKIDSTKFKKIDLDKIKLGMISSFFIDNNETEGHSGAYELDIIFSYLKNLNIKAKVEFDISLARGLNYYTGAIFEVKANDFEIGSISGGGRYDNLTGVFGMEGVSGVGISFGADRIYDVLQQLNKFPAYTSATAKVLIAHFGDPKKPGDTIINESLNLIRLLRDHNISAEIYPELDKIQKNFSYANAKKIPFVITIGEDEIKSGLYELKNMETEERKKLSLEELIEHLKLK
jgi:histidyl-tRNA synthetase